MFNSLKFHRRKRFYFKFFASFITLFSFGASIVTLTPISLNCVGSGVSISLIFIISVIFSFISTPKIEFLTDEVIPFKISSERKCKIVFPCTYEQYKIANKIANSSYKKKDNLNFDEIECWRKKNPFILSLFYDPENKVKGYFDVLPLTKEFEEKLREGKLTEKDINSESMLSPEEMYHSEIIYIGGVAVLDIEKYGGSYYCGLIMIALYKYLKTFYSFEKPVTICATAATTCGERMLKRLGFTIYKEGHYRKDEHDYYIQKVSLRDVKKMEKEIGKRDHKIDCSAYKNYEYKKIGNH
ncbi:MAG: hypothetical protein LBQ08_00470 [Holosporaceae bacterium]|jgi:hypothetical protein|nr:hypothetical protein [Holosporaceae bacterium]